MSASATIVGPVVPASPSARHDNAVRCKHCHTVFVPVAAPTEFCCAGCEYVHRLITGQNLSRFYQLRQGAGVPVRSVVFQPRDYRWLLGLVQRAEQDARKRGDDAPARLELDVQGISCVGCVWLIERLWRDRAGAASLRVNASLGRLTLQWSPRATDIVAFAEELHRFGYLTGPATKAPRTESSALLIRLGLCAAFAMNGMLFALPAYLGMTADFPFARLFVALSFVFATASVLTGGTYFFRRSWHSLRRGVLHIDLPISLGIVAGFAGSIHAWVVGAPGFAYFDFVSTFTFLMLVGRWTQLVAVERNRHRLLGLQDDLPDVRLIAANGNAPVHREVATKPARALVRGDCFALAPGEVLPVSGMLVGAAGSLGMDWISGESEARTVMPGQLVESGAINLSPHELQVTALENWETSLLARLLATPTATEWRNRALERVIRAYILVVMFIALAGAAAWWWLAGDAIKGIHVMVAVLVVSCPCALGVTLPLLDELAVAHLRRAGVFVRTESLWARLRRVRKVIFDKTGTLTLESLVLRNPTTIGELDPAARVALWSLVRLARHPAAACVREAMMARGWNAADIVAEVHETVGQGLEWRDARGRAWRLGRSHWVGTTPDEPGDLTFGCDGRVLARFITSEEVRSDAAAEVARLQERGLEIFILSGDRAEKVAAMARHLGLPPAAAIGAMTPAEKASWVRAIDHGDTLMIGDGANDSLAFDAATCRGTPAIERGLLAARADFYFLGRGLDGMRRLFDVARQRHRTVLQVRTFAAAYNVGAIVLSLAGVMSPLLAAVLMPASALASLALATWGMRHPVSRANRVRPAGAFRPPAGDLSSHHWFNISRSRGSPLPPGPG